MGIAAKAAEGAVAAASAVVVVEVGAGIVGVASVEERAGGAELVPREKKVSVEGGEEPVVGPEAVK